MPALILNWDNPDFQVLLIISKPRILGKNKHFFLHILSGKEKKHNFFLAIRCDIIIIKAVKQV